MGVLTSMEDERSILDASLIQRHFIRQLWPQVAPLLTRATELSHGRYDIADLYGKLLKDDNWHLWAVYEPDGTVVAAITSMFLHYPQGKFLSGQFLGGNRLEDWKDLFCDIFERWGRDNQCVAIELTGRAGWAKALAPNGYDEVYRTYQKDL